MFRIIAGRSALALLVALLVALPFFAPTASFASAHTARHVEAKAQTGITLSGSAQRGETVTHRHCDPSGGPIGPLRTRDRTRAADFTPEGPERGHSAPGPAAAHEPAVIRAPGTSRSSTAHTPAALQVFRC
ncbi:hypothetical protein ACIBL8_20710 [Streptomyces sp. NPDC050523]|uniref:hypothetical protein n=1 Tax=Streptomyces sp. NPDC050523 TaxID=3365622 RepID=UPI0037B885E2